MKMVWNKEGFPLCTDGTLSQAKPDLGGDTATVSQSSMFDYRRDSSYLQPSLTAFQAHFFGHLLFGDDGNLARSWLDPQYSRLNRLV
jgi:hypothetical protein